MANIYLFVMTFFNPSPSRTPPTAIIVGHVSCIFRTCNCPARWPQTAASSVKILELLTRIEQIECDRESQMVGKCGENAFPIITNRTESGSEGEYEGSVGGETSCQAAITYAHSCERHLMQMLMLMPHAPCCECTETRPFFGGMPAKPRCAVWVTLESATILIDSHSENCAPPRGAPGSNVQLREFAMLTSAQYWWMADVEINEPRQSMRLPPTNRAHWGPGRAAR